MRDVKVEKGNASHDAAERQVSIVQPVEQEYLQAQRVNLQTSADQLEILQAERRQLVESSLEALEAQQSLHSMLHAADLRARRDLVEQAQMQHEAVMHQAAGRLATEMASQEQTRQQAQARHQQDLAALRAQHDAELAALRQAGGQGDHAGGSGNNQRSGWRLWRR